MLLTHLLICRGCSVLHASLIWFANSANSSICSSKFSTQSLFNSGCWWGRHGWSRWTGAPWTLASCGVQPVRGVKGAGTMRLGICTPRTPALQSWPWPWTGLSSLKVADSSRRSFWTPVTMPSLPHCPNFSRPAVVTAGCNPLLCNRPFV